VETLTNQQRYAAVMALQGGDMSQRMFKVLVIGALLVSALASSASATSWTTNGTAGGTPFNGTAPAAKFLFTATGGKKSGFVCTTASYSGSLFGPTHPGPTWNNVSSLTPAFGGCTIAGWAWTVDCSAAKLNAASYAAPVVIGSVSSINCRIASNTLGCGVVTAGVPTGGITLTGTIPANYDNTATQLTMKTTGQSLTALWTNGCKATHGTSPGTVLFGTNTAGLTDPADLVTTVTSAFKPSIVQP
jgi:hypothetical protein